MGPALRTLVVAIFAFVALFARAPAAHAQPRGIYAQGMNATNWAAPVETGIANQELFQLYTFERFNGLKGNLISVATYTFIVDLPTETNALTAASLENTVVAYWRLMPADAQIVDASRSKATQLLSGGDSSVVSAIGFSAKVILPQRRFSVGLKWFKESYNNTTVEGQSLQIAARITF